MHLAELIRDQTDAIASEWAMVARNEVASDKTLPPLELLDHFPVLLAELVASLDEAKGSGDEYVKEAAHHAQHRLERGFQLREVVHEYRILRQVLFRHVVAAPMQPGILDDLARMNESLDLAAAEAVDRFSSLRERQARAEMDETAAFRERFIAIVSHDLRSLVGAISMGAQVILRTEGLSPHLSRLVGRILVNTDRMKRMISDLLDLTRGRLGGGIPIAPGPTHLPSVAKAAIDNVLAARPDREIATVYRGDLDGAWDADRLGQVMSNLLDNALAHGDPESPVRLTLEDAGEAVRIAVHNRGVPIPAADLPHVFEAFRSAGASRSSNGLGLGLFIASEIVRAHEGEIAVTSTAAEGTTFTVTLPRRARAAEDGANA